MDKRRNFKKALIFLVPLVFAGVIKIVVSPAEITPFNADEAIVALMARHINQGNIPIFFYGQSYMGSLDALLVALGFRILGEGIWVIRLLQSILYLGAIFTGMMLASRLLESPRGIFFTGMIMAIPTVNVTLYSTVSLGGYGEMLLIGNLLLLSGLDIMDQIDHLQGEDKKKLYLGLILWGMGAGFAFWVIGLALVYIIPMLLAIFWKLYKRTPTKMFLPVLILITGGLIGSSPWWFAAVTSKDLGVITELAGGAIKGAGSTPWLLKPLTRVLNLFVFGGTVLIGLRPPWDIRWLMLPILPFALIFWLTVLIHGVKSIFEKKDFNGFVVLALMGVVLAAGFIFSPYGDDPSGRYFIPLITPMAIFGAYLLISKLSGLKNLDIGVLLLVLIFNLGGTIQSARTYPPGITTQFDSVAQVDQRYMGELIQFLRDNQINSGYSNYWVAYPLSFLSEEELIFIPRLPYHEDFRYTARDDRYQPYQEIVESSRTPSYITTKHPALNDYLRNEFQDKGISWDEEEIGDFHIFYNLSEEIHVYQLGLGVTTSP